MRKSDEFFELMQDEHLLHVPDKLTAFVCDNWVMIHRAIKAIEPVAIWGEAGTRPLTDDEYENWVKEFPSTEAEVTRYMEGCANG